MLLNLQDSTLLPALLCLTFHVYGYQIIFQATEANDLTDVIYRIEWPILQGVLKLQNVRGATTASLHCPKEKIKDVKKSLITSRALSLHWPI